MMSKSVTHYPTILSHSNSSDHNVNSALDNCFSILSNYIPVHSIATINIGYLIFSANVSYGYLISFVTFVPTCSLSISPSLSVGF